MSYLPGDPRNWQSQCCNCKVGRECQMASFKPEPDLPPHHQRYKPPPFEVVNCSNCGSGLSLRSKYGFSSTGLCISCYKSTRKHPATCTEAGCDRKSRRRGLCNRHYEAWLTTRQEGYRDKADRIIKYQAARR